MKIKSLLVELLGLIMSLAFIVQDIDVLSWIQPLPDTAKIGLDSFMV